MKLFNPLLLLVSASLFLFGCASDMTLNSDRYHTFIYSNTASNQHVFLNKGGYQNLVEIAEISPHSKNYKLIISTIDYSIRTKSPVCLRYSSRMSRTIRGVCPSEKT